MKEPPAAGETGWGILTATVDEGFPTPSSSGTEASGAAENPQATYSSHEKVPGHQQPLGVTCK